MGRRFDLRIPVPQSATAGLQLKVRVNKDNMVVVVIPEKDSPLWDTKPEEEALGKRFFRATVHRDEFIPDVPPTATDPTSMHSLPSISSGTMALKEPEAENARSMSSNEQLAPDEPGIQFSDVPSHTADTIGAVVPPPVVETNNIGDPQQQQQPVAPRFENGFTKQSAAVNMTAGRAAMILEQAETRMNQSAKEEAVVYSEHEETFHRVKVLVTISLLLGVFSLGTLNWWGVCASILPAIPSYYFYNAIPKCMATKRFQHLDLRMMVDFYIAAAFFGGFFGFFGYMLAPFISWGRGFFSMGTLLFVTMWSATGGLISLAQLALSLVLIRDIKSIAAATTRPWQICKPWRRPTTEEEQGRAAENYAKEFGELKHALNLVSELSKQYPANGAEQEANANNNAVYQV